MAADPRPIVLALYFHPSDARALWDLASRHTPDDPEEMSWFVKAARATENGLPVVLECSVRAQVEQTSSFFIEHGIRPPRIEELRI